MTRHRSYDGPYEARGRGDMYWLGQEGDGPPGGRPVLAKQGGENVQFGLPEHTWHKGED